MCIDAADAFAFGQVYVALSRCRSLEGLTLTTPLTPHVTFNDTSVSQFVDTQPTFEQAEASADDYERQYHIEKLMELFGIDDMVRLAERLLEHYGKLKNIYPKKLTTLRTQHSVLLDLQTVSDKFKAQLMHLDEETQKERALKGAKYYLGQLTPLASQLPTLLDVDIDNKTTKENINESGKHLSEVLGMKLACLTAVEKKGYSVQTVQHAKVDYIMGQEEKKNSRERTAKPEKQHGSASIDNDLAVAIRNWRSMKASEQHVAPYIILQQKALHSIATNMPRTIAELKRQLGVGAKTVERYGAELLEIVNDYANNNI